MSCNSSFWTERLAVKQALLAEMDDAYSALVVGNLQSYTLDTGQTRQTVTKANLSQLRTAMDDLENRIHEIMLRLSGCNTVNVRQGR